MKKTSSYQKLKIKNKKLEKEIYNLVMKPETMEAQRIKLCYEIKFGISEIIWAGDATLNTGIGLNKIIK